MTEVHLKVTGMTCWSSVANIKKSLAKLTGESLYTTLLYPRGTFECPLNLESDFRDSPVAPMKWQNTHKPHTWCV